MQMGANGRRSIRMGPVGSMGVGEHGNVARRGTGDTDVCANLTHGREISRILWFV